MSTYYTNECVDCGLPCLGSSCPNRNVEHWECDLCGQTDEEIKVIEEGWGHICEDCYNERENKKAQKLLQILYQWYVTDWLKSRNLSPDDIDEETGAKKGPYKNCIYACYEEFLDAEYCENDYVDYLCQQNGYKNLNRLCEKYEVDIDFME